MEGIRRRRESARNIFERGVRTGQRNVRFIVREECKKNTL
jgi:hypothetical protein